MVTWLEDAASLLSGGRFDRCETHDDHSTHFKLIPMEGRSLPDWPPVEQPLCLTMKMNLFDWTRYENTYGYCAGDDEVSKTIDFYSMWEGYETVLALDVLSFHQRSYVLDFGSHIGWFTLVAALTGHDVLAIDADIEHLAVLSENVVMNDVSDHVVVARGWVGPDTMPLTVLPDRQVRLIKSDLEGEDHHVVRICRPLLEAGKVDYLMMEVSPVFSDKYGSTIEDLDRLGYHPYLVPDKSDGRPSRYSKAPLKSVLQCPLRSLESVSHQRTVLFVRGDA